MSAGNVVIWGVVGALAIVNGVITRRLWASPIFEGRQKIAQSVLIWLIPGSFVFVRHALGDHLPGRSLASSDPTPRSWEEGESEYGDTHGHQAADGVSDGGGSSVGGAD